MPKFASALALPEQASPGNPPAGWVAVFARTGGILWTRSSAGAERLLEPGVLFAFSKTGTLTTGTGTHRIYNDSGSTLTIKAVRASVGTPPSGGSIVVDVNVSASTIFSTQANRPTITTGNFTSGKVTNYNTTTISDGAYFTVDVDAVSGGADLTVQILC
jgi:hypothetical protein